MSLDQITSSNIWMRLVDAEYENMDEQEFSDRFKTIYLEETGELFEGEIKMYHSSDSEKIKGINSSYDGTAFTVSYSEEKNLYLISQGTQGGSDWLYNVEGPFANEKFDQAEAARTFVIEAKDHFDFNPDEGEVISFNHSLGLHNSSMTGLSEEAFDEVYGVNGLTFSPYEIISFDAKFYNAVRKEFDIKRIEEIDKIPLADLKGFTKDYYSDAQVTISNTVSEDDPLYLISEKFGFVPFDNTTMVDTNPEVSGLKELIDNIPDSKVNDLRNLAAAFSRGNQKGGFNQGLNEALGVNITNLKSYNAVGVGAWYINYPDEVDETMEGLQDNLPVVLENIRLIEENSEEIFNSLYEYGYISKEQKDVMIKELTNLEKELTRLNDAVDFNVDMHNEDGWFDKIRRGIGDTGLAAVAAILYYKIPNILDRIKESGTLESLEGIVESHSITEMLNALAEGNRSYVGKDLVFTSDTGGGDPIKVNMSAALRLYTQGVTSLEVKQTLITELETLVRDEIEFAYKDQRWKVMHEIYNVESSPSSYAYELGQYRFPSYKISSVNVLHEILPLEQADLDEEIADMKHSVDTGFNYIENYRKAIEDLFKEDEEVSTLFDLSRRI
ncbi:hypothetical protein SAMN05421663_10591 [Terribacillus halophilus]|uniref:DUF6792 domain-containing protein n=1 Tax=Terribacillus halophilus TaxID=361279 RepID=A0A1G6QHR7_9BACI|nr:DUF6792 domain-containing protein [Terribacillus halophilus]SDC92032.1 hypothetical protein SAMN05421663_10591 [Terribacillus halophilus]